MSGSMFGRPIRKQVTSSVDVPSDYPAVGVEARLIQRLVKVKSRRVLEIGCGDGRLTLQYAPLAANVVAIEPDAARIRTARLAAAAEGVTNVSFRGGTAESGRFALIGRINHQFRVRLSNPTQLDRYLHQGQRPPRFPAGGRSRLHALWKSRKPGTQIEVTEFMAIIALRAIDRFHD